MADIHMKGLGTTKKTQNVNPQRLRFVRNNSGYIEWDEFRQVTWTTTTRRDQGGMMQCVYLLQLNSEVQSGPKNNDTLAGGFKYFLFSPLFAEDFHFDLYFSKGLKPPTSIVGGRNPSISRVSTWLFGISCINSK